jgi:hypothetical protein
MIDSKYLIIGGLGIMALMAGKAAAAGVMSRGIRNNNPGNIRFGSQWQGMAKEQPDKEYITFIAPEWGIRAISKTLDTYANKHGLHTVRGIVSRWAPANENNTQSYIDDVADSLGVTPLQNISVDYYKEKLIKAIIQHENGVQPYSDELIKKAIGMQ